MPELTGQAKFKKKKKKVTETALKPLKKIRVELRMSDIFSTAGSDRASDPHIQRRHSCKYEITPQWSIYSQPSSTAHDDSY